MRQAGTFWNEFLASKGKKFPEILISFLLWKDFQQVFFIIVVGVHKYHLQCLWIFLYLLKLKLFCFSFHLIRGSDHLNSNDMSVDGMRNGTLVLAQYRKDIHGVVGGKLAFTNYCSSF